MDSSNKQHHDIGGILYNHTIVPNGPIFDNEWQSEIDALASILFKVYLKLFVCPMNRNGVIGTGWYSPSILPCMHACFVVFVVGNRLFEDSILILFCPFQGTNY